MTVADSNSLETLFSTLRRQRRQRVRPLFWTMFWASLATLTWSAFKLSQARLQPDAIATGGPGFLYRLVIRPMEWAMNAVVPTDPVLVASQVTALIAICVAVSYRLRASQTLLGGSGSRRATF